MIVVYVSQTDVFRSEQLDVTTTAALTVNITKNKNIESYSHTHMQRVIFLSFVPIIEK